MQSGCGNCIKGWHSIADQSAQNVNQTTKGHQIIGQDIIRANGQSDGQARQSAQRCDRLGQDIIMRSAQFDSEASAQFGEQIIARDNLMIGFNARTGKALQISSCQPARMAAHKLARLQASLNNAAHFIAALQHAAHIHHFGKADYFWHAEQLSEFGRIKISAGEFKTRC